MDKLNLQAYNDLEIIFTDTYMYKYLDRNHVEMYFSFSLITLNVPFR